MAFKFEIEKGVVDAPERIAIIGEGGIGKTTFAASSPRPFFLDVERGSRKFRHVDRNANITTWQTLIDNIEWLRTEKHDYKTAVLDTLDRTESYLWRHLRHTNKTEVDSIELVGGGYGRGYSMAGEKFRELFASLEKLVEERGMHIIISAHPKLEKVRNPSGSDYERFVFKVRPEVGNMMFEACDHVLFAGRNITVTDEVYDESRPKAIGGDKRILYTHSTPALMAKTRGRNMPSPIPLSWHQFVCHLAAGGFPRLLRETMQENARRLGDPKTIKAIDDMVGESDVNRMANGNTKLLALLEAADKSTTKLSVEGVPATDDVATVTTN